MSSVAQMQDALAMVAPRGVVNTIATTFVRMGIAENEITRAQQDHPADRERINSAFGVLMPTPILRDKEDQLYRLHVREMIERVRLGYSPAKLREATDAEMLAWLSDASLVAPPGAQHAALQEDLFLRLLPGSNLRKRLFREPWQGASEEMRAQLRRMLTFDRGDS